MEIVLFILCSLILLFIFLYNFYMFLYSVHMFPCHQLRCPAPHTHYSTAWSMISSCLHCLKHDIKLLGCSKLLVFARIFVLGVSAPHTLYTAWSMISSCLAAQSCLFLLGYSCWAHKPHTHYTFNFGWYHAAWLLIRESLQGQENSGQVKPLKPRPMSPAVTWDAHKDPALMLVYTRTWIGRLLILLLILSCVQSLLFFRWVDGKRLLAVWSCGKLLLI